MYWFLSMYLVLIYIFIKQLSNIMIIWLIVQLLDTHGSFYFDQELLL